MGEASKPGLSDEKAARMMIALRAGQTLKRFGVTASRLEAHFETHPEYAREARPLIEANAKAARLRKGAGRSYKFRTHCLRGHALTQDNLYFKSTNGTRQCRTCTIAAVRRGGPVSQKQIEKVRRAVLTGMTIKAITRPSDGKPIMTFPQLKRVRLESAELNRFIIENVTNWRSLKTLLSQQGIAPLRGIESKIHLGRPADDIELYEFQPGDVEWLYGLTPRFWPKFARDEVVGDLFLQLSERLIRRADVPGMIKSHITKHNRMFPPNFAKFGDGRLVSLDARLFEDGAMTLGDTISRGLWD
jgi:hypothetical protein